MILDLTEWLWEHRMELSLNALLLFILRRFILKELARILRPSRTEAVLNNQKIIMERMGLGEEWKSNLPMNGLKITLPRLSKKLYLFSRMVTKRPKTRRIRTMNNQNINYATLIPTLAMALKLILQVFGIELPDEKLNAIVDLISAIGVIVGIYLPHTKAVVATEKTLQKVAASPIAANPNATYKDMVKTVNTVHGAITNILSDLQKDDGSAAFHDAANAYTTLLGVVNDFRHPEPLQDIPEKVTA